MRHDDFKRSFFFSTISEWNKLERTKIRNSTSLNIFQKNLLNFKWPYANSIFDIQNPYEIKILTRLSRSYLHEHKLCFQDTLDPLCACCKNVESTTHFFFHCTNFPISRKTLLQNIRNIDEQILSQKEIQITQIFLYGNRNYNFTINRLIINSAIEYLTSTERFQCSLLN